MKKNLFSPVLATLMVVFGLMATVMPAQADFINGKQLQLYCLSQNPNDDAICIVYVTGAVDAFTTMDIIAQKTENTAARYCIPDDVGPDQLREVVVNWLDRPETNLDFAATLLVLGAIDDAYACAS